MALPPPLVQRDSLAVDHAASLASLAAQSLTWDGEVARHAEWLRQLSAALVYSDMPPLPLLAARAAGIRAVALGNFTWQWIYEQYRELDERYAAPARRAAQGYDAAGRLLRLPTFPALPLEPHHAVLPWVTRSPTRSAEDVRAVLGIADGRPLVLLSFGGHAGVDLAALSASRWARGVHLVGGRQLAAMLEPHHLLDEEALERAGIRYIDVVGAADVVVSKPGYGILADCLAGQCRLVSLERPEFPEASQLLEPAMRELLGAVTVPVGARHAAGIIEAVDTALGRPRPVPRCALDGAEQAASEVAALLDRT